MYSYNTTKPGGNVSRNNPTISKPLHYQRQSLQLQLANASQTSPASSIIYESPQNSISSILSNNKTNNHSRSFSNSYTVHRKEQQTDESRISLYDRGRTNSLAGPTMTISHCLNIPATTGATAGYSHDTIDRSQSSTISHPLDGGITSHTIAASTIASKTTTTAKSPGIQTTLTLPSRNSNSAALTISLPIHRLRNQVIPPYMTSDTLNPQEHLQINVEENSQEKHEKLLPYHDNSIVLMNPNKQYLSGQSLLRYSRGFSGTPNNHSSHLSFANQNSAQQEPRACSTTTNNNQKRISFYDYSNGAQSQPIPSLQTYNQKLIAKQLITAEVEELNNITSTLEASDSFEVNEGQSTVQNFDASCQTEALIEFAQVKEKEDMISAMKEEIAYLQQKLKLKEEEVQILNTYVNSKKALEKENRILKQENTALSNQLTQLIHQKAQGEDSKKCEIEAYAQEDEHKDKVIQKLEATVLQLQAMILHERGGKKQQISRIQERKNNNIIGVEQQENRPRIIGNNIQLQQNTRKQLPIKIINNQQQQDLNSSSEEEFQNSNRINGQSINNNNFSHNYNYSKQNNDIQQLKIESLERNLVVIEKENRILKNKLNISNRLETS